MIELIEQQRHRLLVSLASGMVSVLVAARVAADDALLARDADAAEDQVSADEAASPDPPIADEFFDRVVFGRRRGDSEAKRRNRIESILRRKLGSVDRVCGLSDAQKVKLDRAGRGDIKRLFDRVEEQRRKFRETAGAGFGPNVLNQLTRETATLRLMLSAGPFDDDSWFVKTLRKTLSPEQAAKYDAPPSMARAGRNRIGLGNANDLVKIATRASDAHRIVFNRDGELLGLVKFDSAVEIYRTLDDRLIRTVGAGRKVVGFDFSPRQNVAAIAENSEHAMIVDLKTGKEITLATRNAQPQARFSPDGTMLATGGYGSAAKLWSAATGELLRELETGVKGGLSPVFSPDGSIVAVGNRNSTTRLFETSTGRLLHVLESGMSQELDFDSSGKTLAVVYVDGSLALWDIATGQQKQVIQTAADELYTVDWSPDGSLLVTAGRNSLVTIWNPEDLSILNELESPEWVVSARFNPDGTRLLFSGGAIADRADRRVETWAVP